MSTLTDQIALDQLIPLFVSKDDLRPSMTVASTIGDFTYASDGYIAIRIPNKNLDNHFTPPKPHPDYAKAFIPVRIFKEPLIISLSAIEEIIKKVETVPGTIKCIECDGEGGEECNLEHWHECEGCGGDGEIESSKVPRKKNLQEEISIQGTNFKTAYFDLLLRCMKECRIESCKLFSGETNRAYLFNLGYCDVLIMPLMADSKSEFKKHTLIP